MSAYRIKVRLASVHATSRFVDVSHTRRTYPFLLYFRPRNNLPKRNRNRFDKFSPEIFLWLTDFSGTYSSERTVSSPQT
jgi:hypothetical protein